MPRRRRHFERKEITRHGKTVWYFRRPGQKRIRLPDAYGSKEYLAAYERCLARGVVGGVAPTSPAYRVAHGSFAWLVGRYKQSGEFVGMAQNSQLARSYLYASACKEAGGIQLKDITREHMQDAMDRRAATPHGANNFLTAMSVLFAWAIKRGHMDTNPCDGVARRKDRIVGHHTWTVEEVEKFRAFYPVGTKARLAVDLLLLTGLRGSDAVRVGPEHVTDGVITIKTGKTGAVVHLPILPELAASLEATPLGETTFLTTRKGKQFGGRADFSMWFKRLCKAAGLPHCSPHGLRKAGATIAAENGATVHQLMAMYGWNRSAMAEVYTKAANRKRLAKDAAELVADYSKGKKPVEKAPKTGDERPHPGEPAGSKSENLMETTD